MKSALQLTSARVQLHFKMLGFRLQALDVPHSTTGKSIQFNAAFQQDN
jgi:hypothetical protein